MNFSQLHEQLRLEMLRRIERGVSSTTTLARKTNFQPAHISNFLRSKRMLSLKALDLILEREHLTVADLLLQRGLQTPAASPHYDTVPLVSQAAAIHELAIHSASIVDLVRVQGGLLKSTVKRCTAGRRNWERFVAVRLQQGQAESMQPILRNKAIVLIDRHYNSLLDPSKERRSIFAVRDGNLLRFRHIEQDSGTVLLRPHDLKASVEVLQPPPGQTYRDLIIGRVFLVISEP
jgi:transcriptional regulator with XRE-family HTH domain